MKTHKSNWGYHAVNYQDYIVLKLIYKRYWETLKEAYAWQRWHRKTVNQAGPEPKVDKLFIEKDKYSHFTTETKDGRTRWHDLDFVRKIVSIVDDFDKVRTPQENEEDVTPIDMAPYKEIYMKMTGANVAQVD